MPERRCRPSRPPGQAMPPRPPGAGRRIDPAGVDAAREGLRDLGVDLPAEAGQAAEGRLDVAARAAEAVVEIEMAEGGVEVVAPHQANHAAAEPDAFRVAGRAIDGLRGLDEFVGLALVVLGARIGRIGGGWLALVLGAEVAALGESAADTESGGQARERRGGAKPHF